MVWPKQAVFATLPRSPKSVYSGVLAREPRLPSRLTTRTCPKARMARRTSSYSQGTPSSCPDGGPYELPEEIFSSDCGLFYADGSPACGSRTRTACPERTRNQFAIRKRGTRKQRIHCRVSQRIQLGQQHSREQRAPPGGLCV